MESMPEIKFATMSAPHVVASLMFIADFISDHMREKFDGIGSHAATVCVAAFVNCVTTSEEVCVTLVVTAVIDVSTLVVTSVPSVVNAVATPSVAVCAAVDMPLNDVSAFVTSPVISAASPIAANEDDTSDAV